MSAQSPHRGVPDRRAPAKPNRMLHPNPAGSIVVSANALHLRQGIAMPSLFAPPRWLAVVALTGLLVVGCKKKVRDPESAGPAPAAAHTGAPLTENDCKEFGEKLAKAVADEDKAAVKNLFRVNDLIERSVSDLGLTANEKKNLLAGAASYDQFGGQFLKVVKEGGSYSVLRVRVVDGRPRVIMRLIHSDGGVSYHEFSLVRYPDGQIATEDVYIYASGEPLSQTFRRFVLGFAAERNQSAIAKLSGEEQVLTKHIGDVVEMGTMVRNGQNKEALAAFRKLPAALQKNKMIQIIALHAAAGTGDDNEYLTEMERFRRDHPNDAAGDLNAIDYYLLKKDYDEMLKAIDRLDRSLGGDPYLEAMKANGLAEAGRFKEARASADKAIQDAPKLLQVYWVRTTVATMAKDHPDTLKCLKALVENVEPGLGPDNLLADERFVEFVKTPQFDEFKKWLAERRK